MLAWRAARIAARRRGLAAGSGRPWRAAVVNSRISLVKTLPRFLSCAPLRYMMFLNCEWPDIVAYPRSRIGSETRAGWTRNGRQQSDRRNRSIEARPNKPIWQDWGDSKGFRHPRESGGPGQPKFLPPGFPLA